MVTDERNIYRGPLFIIGMPRSGTKLLRGMLCQHSKIALPIPEGGLLPYLDKLILKYGPISNITTFKKFYKVITRQPYFAYIKEDGRKIISEQEWYSRLRAFTPAEVFEVLMRHDADCLDSDDIIWGTKSPSYMRHVPYLVSLYPQARFLHIVRDVRDYCLSINRAWGKNVYRAAQRWTDDVGAVNQLTRQGQARILEIRYEDLLVNTGPELKKICNFLDIEYEKQMTALARPVENLGDAKGCLNIKQNNINKYQGAMSKDMQSRIEEIAGDVLRIHNYPVTKTERQRVTGFQMMCFQMADGLNIMRFSIRERGLVGAFQMRFRAYIKNLAVINKN